MDPADPITSLYDAARELEAVYERVARVLDDAWLLERAHHLAVADAGAIVEGIADEATEQALEQQSGWRRYYTAADRIIEALGDIERRRQDAHVATFGDRL